MGPVPQQLQFDGEVALDREWFGRCGWGRTVRVRAAISDRGRYRWSLLDDLEQTTAISTRSFGPVETPNCVMDPNLAMCRRDAEAALGGVKLRRGRWVVPSA